MKINRFRLESIRNQRKLLNIYWSISKMNETYKSQKFKIWSNWLICKQCLTEKHPQQKKKRACFVHPWVLQIWVPLADRATEPRPGTYGYSYPTGRRPRPATFWDFSTRIMSVKWYITSAFKNKTKQKNILSRRKKAPAAYALASKS